MLPRQLRQSELWWHGPQWLKSDASKWPPSWQNPHNKEDHLFPERKLSKPVNIINTEPELPVLQKFSSVKKICRVIAYVLRFVNNLKNKTKNQKALSVEELEHARPVVLKYIQSREFADEIRCIQKSKRLKCQRLAKLDPFIDENGLLRVGGRLKHSLLAYESKFPILLPEKHHVTKWIIRETHEDELHAGNEATLAAVRQRYWPISGRNIVRKITHSCVKCNRANPKPISQKMGDLPKERLQPSGPFFTSGVDYAGPYLIKSSKLRNAKKFNFIPARSPHFGGLWERCVQSVKHHMRRILVDASITYEEFYTLLTRIEACLNSRPLIPLSQDPNDLVIFLSEHHSRLPTKAK
jgi:hypothetical protein